MTIFLTVTLFLFVLTELNIITLAFLKIGIPPRFVVGTLFALLLGSFINIPIREIPRDNVVRRYDPTTFLGLRYVVPPPSRPGTMVVAVNLGGAILPTAISIYLLVQTGLYSLALVGVLFMTSICYSLARPIEGVGISLPLFVPSFLAALFAVVIVHNHAPAVAYISGSMGALIGADLLKLKDIARLNAPVVSIGGAGTFDGIFLTGIVAVLLAAYLT